MKVWHQAVNYLHFHRKEVVFNTLAGVTYLKVCHSALNWNNEYLRVAVAGSLAQGTVEGMFHFVDTVNIKSKAGEGEAHSTMTMIRKILAEEGVRGFGRGFGAAVYGNYSVGFIYFFAYKWLKTNMPQWSGKNLISAAIAETVAMALKFPFDLVKCRMQSVNYIFKYANWFHGLRKEFNTNGVKGLYQGVFPFWLTYCTFIPL